MSKDMGREELLQGLEAFYDWYCVQISPLVDEPKVYAQLVKIVKQYFAEQSGEVDELAGFLAELREVVDSSRGVVGWHLNDDIATWDELDITVDRIDAFLQQKQFPEPGVDVHGIAKHIMDTFPRVNDIMTESRLRELIKEGQHES